MTVTKDGFATLKRDGIVLRVGDQINLDLSLQIGKLAVEQARHGNIRRLAELREHHVGLHALVADPKAAADHGLTVAENIPSKANARAPLRAAGVHPGGRIAVFGRDETVVYIP